MFATILASALIVSLAVLIHYEMLRFLSLQIPKMNIVARAKVLFALLGALLAHVAEVMVFALGFYWMVNASDSKRFNFGELYDLDGNLLVKLQDCIYFSFSSYTSLGLGDLYPLGPIRFLTGMEALTGLVLITWTASFIYLEMQRDWQPGRGLD